MSELLSVILLVNTQHLAESEDKSCESWSEVKAISSCSRQLQTEMKRKTKKKRIKVVKLLQS